MTRIAALVHLVAALAFAAAPLATPGFDGFEPAQFPIRVEDPPVQPAGWAFAIWGVIYLWLLAGAGFGLLARADSADWAAMRWPLIGSLALGAAWLGVAQAAPVLATGLIWAMLALALWSLARVGDRDRLWQEAPVALYAGWLTAASCVGSGIVLAGYGLASPQNAALIFLMLALAIAVVVALILTRAPEYAAGVIWALGGVIADNLSPVNPTVLSLAAAGILALAGTVWVRRPV
ncbi:MAG: hypothetical protein ACLFQL_10470 [Paracoccaceae bacterium]